MDVSKDLGLIFHKTKPNYTNEPNKYSLWADLVWEVAIHMSKYPGMSSGVFIDNAMSGDMNNDQP